MKNYNYAIIFIFTALIALLIGVIFGLLGGLQYVMPNFIKEYLPFNAIRPLHTLFVVSWVLLAAIGGIYYYLSTNVNFVFYSKKLIKIHFWIFILTGICIAISYLSKNFGGKEYLEFPSYFYFPIVIGWILFGVNYYKTMLPSFKNWPVYYWMWATGIFLMIFHFTEAHFWLLPYFRDHYIQNLALQWKSGGSYVGAWNMLVYGTSIYVMDKTSNDTSYSTSKKAFFFYFLGLTNLMFGWAHHIYIIPTAPWIRYFAYVISMTEWIILFSIIYEWKENLTQEKKKKYVIACRLMLLADLWVFLNIILALLISIPAINLFTHGTHITVAHSMGTTIGINTFILLSSITYIFNKITPFSIKTINYLNKGISVFQFSFIFFWISLLLMGVKKTYWQFYETTVSFARFQSSQYWLNIAFVCFGVGMITGLAIIVFNLSKNLQSKLKY